MRYTFLLPLVAMLKSVFGGSAWFISKNLRVCADTVPLALGSNYSNMYF